MSGAPATKGLRHLGLTVTKLEESCFEPSGIRLEFLWPG